MNQLPTVLELKQLFVSVNNDIAIEEAKNNTPIDESLIVPLTDVEFYAEQIENLFECTSEQAEQLAAQLAEA